MCASANRAFVLLLHRPHVSQRFLFAFMNLDDICCGKSLEYRIFSQHLYLFRFYCGLDPIGHYICILCVLCHVVVSLVVCSPFNWLSSSTRNGMKGRKKLNVIDFISKMYWNVRCCVCLLFLHQQQRIRIKRRAAGNTPNRLKYVDIAASNHTESTDLAQIYSCISMLVWQMERSASILKTI